MKEKWYIVWHEDGDYKNSINRQPVHMGSVFAATRAEAVAKAKAKYRFVRNGIITEYNPKTHRFTDAEMILIQADCKCHDHCGLIGIYRANWMESYYKSIQELQNKVNNYKKPNRIKPFTSLETRIQKKIIRADSGCWLWTGALTHGYGKVTINKKRFIAHRYVYNKLVGQIPPGAELLHTCDNRMCVSPYHLEVGTSLDNAKDRAKKNRNGSGWTSDIYFVRNDPVESAFHSTPPDVRKKIKVEYYRKRVPKYKLERQYNISRSALNEILHLLSIEEQKHIFNSVKRGLKKESEFTKNEFLDDLYICEIMMKFIGKDMGKIRIKHYADGIGLRKLSNTYCVPYEMIKSIVYYNKITVAFGSENSVKKIIWTGP